MYVCKDVQHYFKLFSELKETEKCFIWIIQVKLNYACTLLSN